MTDGWIPATFITVTRISISTITEIHKWQQTKKQ